MHFPAHNPKRFALSKADLDVRVSEAKEKAALNPRKRGPKPKLKQS